MNQKFKRITIDPEIINGQPCIRGMRLTVRRVVEAVALYPDRAGLKLEGALPLARHLRRPGDAARREASPKGMRTHQHRRPAGGKRQG